jgi:hypothetical protein
MDSILSFMSFLLLEAERREAFHLSNTEVEAAAVDRPGEESSSESLRNQNFPKASVLSADFGTTSFGFSELSSPFGCEGVCRVINAKPNLTC